MPGLIRRHGGHFAFATTALALAVGVNLVVFTLVNALWIHVGIAPDLALGSLAPPASGAVITTQPMFDAIVSHFAIRTDRPDPVAGSVRRTVRGRVVKVATGRELVAHAETNSIDAGRNLLYGNDGGNAENAHSQRHSGPSPVLLLQF